MFAGDYLLLRDFGPYEVLVNASYNRYHGYIVKGFWALSFYLYAGCDNLLLRDFRP
jgi:hypothetical protein